MTTGKILTTNDSEATNSSDATSSLRSSASSGSSRPSSHHRRRSSVSTRRESAEIMGLSPATLADLPTQDDADTDCIRRRALWALEGKSGDGAISTGYSKVEIPEFASPDMDRKFEFPSKNAFSTSNATTGGKRDSFGRVLGPLLPSKDQLHTLVEEDEEEDEQEVQPRHVDETQMFPSVPCSHLKPLNLKPLVSSVTSGPSQRSGLKPLTLAMSPPSTTFSLPSRRSSQSHGTDLPKRRSSLSYKRSLDVSSSGSSHSLIIPTNTHLPTPESTPVTAERPLSPSEQAFLHNNHSSLLFRISELERVLAIRTYTTSVATSSSRQLSISSIASDGPSDEMLCLVRDLKAERDDLVRDVNVLQTRAEDLEKQINLLTRRVENERRDAWQAREQLTSLEGENRKMQRVVNEANFQISELQNALARSRSAESNLAMCFKAEQARREGAERELERQIRTPRLTADKFEFMQVEGGSGSIIPDDVDVPVCVVPVKSASEDDDDVEHLDEDELAHYEDEGEDDPALYSDDSFSESREAVSMFPRSLQEIRPQSLLSLPMGLAAPLLSPSSAGSSTPPPTPSPVPLDEAHRRKKSLETGWSFPRGSQPVVRNVQEIDRFFECLNVLDTTLESSSPFSVADVSEGKDKYGFFQDAEDTDDDEPPPFVIPVDSSRSARASLFGLASLEIVVEEGEETSVIGTTLTSSAFSCDGGHEVHQAKRKPVPSVKEESAAYPGTTRSTHAPSPQTPRKPQPSSIPKLSPPQSSTLAKSLIFPATPTSIPRAKAPADSAVASFRRAGMTPPQFVTPTKLPIARSNVHPQSASSPSKNSMMLKSPTALTALASYLPWSGWSLTEDNRVDLSATAGTNHSASLIEHPPARPPRTQGPLKKSTLGSTKLSGLVLL